MKNEDGCAVSWLRVKNMVAPGGLSNTLFPRDLIETISKQIWVSNRSKILGRPLKAYVLTLSMKSGLEDNASEKIQKKN